MSWTHELGDLQILHNKGTLSGIKYCKLSLCKFYIMDIQRGVPFSTSQHKIKGLLDLIHTNMWGPSTVAFIASVKYYITFIDDFFRRV